MAIQKHGSGEDHIFRTSGFKPESAEELGRTPGNIYFPIFLLHTALLVWFLGEVYARQPLNAVLGIELAALGALGTIAVFLSAGLWCGMLRFNRDENEWHALEHKAVALLWNGLPVTVHGLKTAPANLASCGTVLLTFNLQIAACPLLIVFLDGALGAGALKIAALSVTGILLISSLYHLMVFKFGKPDVPSRLLNSALQCLRIPAVIPGLILQRVFTLRAPSEDKFELVARELSRFMAKLEAPPQTDNPA